MFLNLWQQQRLLPPYDSRVHGLRLRRWSYVLMALAMYEVISIPLQLAFYDSLPRGDDAYGPPVAQIALNYVIDAPQGFFVLPTPTTMRGCLSMVNRLWHRCPWYIGLTKKVIPACIKIGGFFPRQMSGLHALFAPPITHRKGMRTITSRPALRCGNHL